MEYSKAMMRNLEKIDWFLLVLCCLLDDSSLCWRFWPAVCL